MQEICRRYGVLLIVDEVICGFGRTGKRFGHQHFGVVPDIVTMAKGITSAYLPLSATAVRADLYEAFTGDDPLAHLRHINTFGGHPAASAVGLKTLTLMEERGIVEQAAARGEFLAAALAELRGHPLVSDVRTFGLMAGMELRKPGTEKTPPSDDLATRTVALCRQRGVIIGKNSDTVPGMSNVLTLAPPLVISEDEIRLMVDTLGAALDEVAADAGRG